MAINTALKLFCVFFPNKKFSFTRALEQNEELEKSPSIGMPGYMIVHAHAQSVNSVRNDER